MQPIVYKLKEGGLKDLEIKDVKDEWSTKDSSFTAKVTTSDNSSDSESSLEVNGCCFQRPYT